ncbi:hypothetical protein [Sphingomonas asaccharolytica]|uniref:hypothetical protein n=1 Tax=Sphingomonas asaccharolytica TaxID=40681 RepID=UPI000830EA76|nr:hypothetical protein [Sphingomonas asaccharolytica]
MIKASLITATALLIATPVVAQTAPPLVKADVAPAPAPTPADPATLAEARLVVGHLLPQGTYKKIMGPMMDSVMGNMGDTMKALPLREIAEMGGLNPKEAAELDKVKVDEVMAIYDPHWRDRMQLSARAMFDAMGDFFSTQEPDIREAMAHAYANHFSLAELTDLERFFSAGSGNKFATQYMTIMADPAMAAEMQSMMPKMMKSMPQFIAAAQKATTSLPAPRKLKDLTPAERTRIAKALGVDESKLTDPKSTT